MDMWELFAKAQHLHFEKGDVLVLTAERPILEDKIQFMKDELSKISDGILIIVLAPDVEISKKEV